jgi:ABC-type transporter Mla subunit MlaD
MVIRATYDGRAFTGSLGFYRDACKNLAMVRNAGRSYSAVIRHTSQLRSKLASLQETFTQLATQWDSVVETAQHMHATQVNLSQFLRDVYPLPQDATKRIQDSYAARVTSIVNRIVSERNRLGVRNSMNLEAATAWEAYNGVQGYVQHDMPRRKENSVFGRALAAMADSGVARALELATAG